MVKLYDKNFKAEDINSVQPGDVIVYESSFSDNYLIVSAIDVVTGKISGQLASRVGVNAVSIEDIVKE